MIKIITAADLNSLASKAAQAPRLRANQNVHESLDSPVQRLFIATEPATYMRPHRHAEAHKWEFFLVLEGQIDLLIFNDAGLLLQRTPMSRTATRAVEIPPDTWHAYVCMQSGTVALEVKQGAYLPTPEHDFAPWAPAENTAAVVDYLAWMRTAQPK
ncbi:MAG: WbuC family cupin fold metalloprotein [Gammaproteobacteria bacterium]|nr:WbuC family cupin fold metalloprotein [Gammaproteobacteria bacterium]